MTVSNAGRKTDLKPQPSPRPSLSAHFLRSEKTSKSHHVRLHAQTDKHQTISFLIEIAGLPRLSDKKFSGALCTFTLNRYFIAANLFPTVFFSFPFLPYGKNEVKKKKKRHQRKLITLVAPREAAAPGKSYCSKLIR